MSGHCTECGCALVYETRVTSMAYRGYTLNLKHAGWWCKSCGEGDIQGEELAKLFSEFKAKVNAGLVGGES